MVNTCIPILITILLIMLIKYNRAKLIDLKEQAKAGNLSGFPFGTIRRIRELKIQKRMQQRKRTNQNRQHGINVRNLRQIETHNPINEQLKYERIATVNIRSVKHKEDLLRNAINDHKIDITIVTETWLQDTDKDTIWVEGSQFNKDGLQIHTYNQKNKKGGGIAIITTSSFKINRLNTTNFNSFEHAVWQVQSGPTNRTILAIYHPPASTQHKTSNSDFIDQLTHLLTTIGSENTNIVLLGDLNLHTDNPEDPDADQLIATLEAFGLEQHIKFPTHQLRHTLDLIATEPATKFACTPIPGPYLSDHRMVIIETTSMKPTEAPQYKEYRKLTTTAITEFQKNFNNQPILDATNLEDAIHQLNDQMLRNLNKVAPLKRRRSLKKTPKSWFNKDLLAQRKIVKNRE